MPLYGEDERRDSRYMDDDEYRRMREAEDDEYEYHGDAADDEEEKGIIAPFFRPAEECTNDSGNNRVDCFGFK